MTSSHPIFNIAKGFYKSLSTLRETHEFEDFKVSVDGEIFPCHSLILALSSEFFSGLLRSNMKERREMTVKLENITSPTFQLILNSLYTGCELLTKENVLEVWSAVHQLQIQFLIEHCETYIMENVSLDTVDIYKTHAEYLQSARVLKYIFNFFLENFSALREKEVFFNLKFKYLTRIIKSDKLVVSSEDEVLDSIFNWVKYGNSLTQQTDVSNAPTQHASNVSFLNNIELIESAQNMEEAIKDSCSKVNIGSLTKEEHQKLLLNQTESNVRKKLLIYLLKATRYFLASEACIVKLYKDKLIQSDISVKEILFEAFNFKFLDCVQGHWPTTAIHRDCSDLEHVGVFCDEERISALSLKHNEWFCIRKLTKLHDSRLTVHKGELYACSRDGASKNGIYVLQTDKWVKVTIVPHAVQLFLTHENYIYVFDSNKQEITRLNPVTFPIELESFMHRIENPAYALSFHDNIVVFSSVDNNGKDETAVHSWNPEKDVWTQLTSFEFSCQNMTSFRDDTETYILDSNGKLLKVTNTEIVGFAYITQLWSGHYNLKGALLFRKTIFIVGDNPDDVDVLHKVEVVYSSKHIWNVNLKFSNFVHHVIPTNELVIRESKE